MDFLSNPLHKDLDHVLVRTEGLWEELRGNSIFITGGTGFFGKWLLESFRHANNRLGLGARLVVLTRHPEAFSRNQPHLAKDPSIQLHPGDVRTFTPPGGEFSFIIHAATEASAKLDRENPQVMRETIVDGTQHVLDFAVTCGCRKFLLVSSGAVYGRQPEGLPRVPEDYALDPDSPPLSAYGEGKRQAETISLQLAAERCFEMKIARGFAFIGPHLPLDTHFAAGNFLRDALAGSPLRIAGDGTPCRSYLYAADLAVWLWTILLRGVKGHAYNVGSPEEVSIRELAELVRWVAGIAAPVEIVVPARPGQPLERYVPEVRRAEVELGLRPWIGLEESVRRTLAYYQAR